MDDVRFQNEVDAIRKMDGVIVKLASDQRGNFIDHASERQDLSFDLGVKVGFGETPESTADVVLHLIQEIKK